MAIRFIRERKGFSSSIRFLMTKTKHRFRLVEKILKSFDYIIGMDASNVSDLRQMCPQEFSIRFTLLHLKVFQILGIQEILGKLMARLQVDVKAWLDRLEKMRVTMKSLKKFLKISSLSNSPTFRDFGSSPFFLCLCQYFY